MNNVNVALVTMVKKYGDDLQYVAYVNNFGHVSVYYPAWCSTYQEALNRMIQCGWDEDMIKIYPVRVALGFKTDITVEEWEALQ